jgi:dTDP-4-dehydrorhamnose reductase
LFGTWIARKAVEFLLLGGSGQVGIELRRLSWPDGARLVAPPRQEVDLESSSALLDIVAARPWTAVINCAAYTAVDRAETERDRAWQVNAAAPQVLAAATAARGTPLIQISTDYVFDGGKREPYVEDDAIAPLNFYGKSKAEGEQAVRKENERHAIVRTSWVFSAHGTNFVKTMLRLGRERPALRIVADQHGCPTAASDLAAAIQTLTLKLASSPTPAYGTFHLCNAGPTTWYDFAAAIFEEVVKTGARAPLLEPITTAEYPTAARRALNSVLDCSRVLRVYGIAMRPWRPALRATLAQMPVEAMPNATGR